tara:strand:+ start:288 stop:482 length:195 start_codon:yes stop_codon:yes gene_type:complete
MNKIKKYINKIYEKSCKYRDKNGYKENLGYDQFYKVTDYMEKFNLTYQQECELKTYFNNKMDTI